MRRLLVSSSHRLVVALLAMAAPLAAQTPRLRTDVEAERVTLEAAFRAAPNDVAAQRAYANILFQLGNVWEAKEIVPPLIARQPPAAEDLYLAAQLAYLTGDYVGADRLYQQMRTVAGSDSLRNAAVRGLALTWYQQNRFDRTRSLPAGAPEDEVVGTGSLLAFMQKFEGTPYGIEWQSPDKVANMPMTNDITAADGLPEMMLEINGHPVNFLLDTGGDRLYLDEGLADQLAIKIVTKRKSKYAYTAGETVEEPLGVADRVKMGEVTLRNVPVIVAQWKARGVKTDGVVTTQLLKQFLTTIDYGNKRVTLRERSARGHQQLAEFLGGKAPYEVPFFMTATHLMFAKGSINGHGGMNLLIDSGLAMSMPLVIINETADMLKLPRTPVPNTKYYWVPMASFGLEGLERHDSQALGNVIVESNPFWTYGFTFDGLISHQYLRHLGSWTIDFDAMKYYFPK